MSPRPRKLLTMSEVSRRTGISMPTLQKYKKEHQDRIPSEGEGRKQRYPLAALPVFEKLKEEGLARRGGGGRKKSKNSKNSKKKAGRPRSKAKAKTKSPAKKTTNEAGLLSLQRIREITGISYPTLLRYVKMHLDRIPHAGAGRKRRYPEEAVEVFRQIRSESPRGRKPKGAKKKAAKGSTASTKGTADGNLAKKIAELQRSQDQLERQVRELKELIKRPITVTMRR